MNHQVRTHPSSIHSQRNSDRLLVSSQNYWIYLILGLLGIGYVCWSFNGYGNHDDIYRMIETWRTLLSEQRYQPSRFQGYLIPEIVIGLSSQLGDFYLSNFISVLLAITSLFITYQLLCYFTAPLPAAIAVFAIGINPYWIIAATTSTDYIYPSFFFLVGVWLLINSRFRVAGLIFALAVSARLTYGPMVAIAFVFYSPYLRYKPHLKIRFIQGISLFLITTGLLYLPVFIASGLNLSFLRYADDTAGGVIGKVVRFFYKNIYFWGAPNFLVLVAYFAQASHFYWHQLCQLPFRNLTIHQTTFQAIFWILIYNQLLFAKLPHQYQYLIPVLFCVIFLITQLPNFQKQIICLSLITALHLIHSVINFDVIETYQTGSNNTTIHADGAVIQPGIREGILLRDYRWRSIYQRQLTDTFNQRWQHFGRSLTNPR